MWAVTSIYEQTERLLETLDKVEACICQIAQILRPRLSATLTIRPNQHKGGHRMPATILVGKTANAMWQEFSGPNGTGDKLPPAGPVTFQSSDGNVASVDPNSGLVTGMALGTAAITGTDQANSLTASDSVTVTETAQSATLTIVPNP